VLDKGAAESLEVRARNTPAFALIPRRKAQPQIGEGHLTSLAHERVDQQAESAPQPSEER
jgi:hypothetical protein